MVARKLNFFVTKDYDVYHQKLMGVIFARGLAAGEVQKPVIARRGAEEEPKEETPEEPVEESLDF